MARQPNKSELLRASQNIAKIGRTNNHPGKSSIYKQAGIEDHSQKADEESRELNNLKKIWSMDIVCKEE